MPYPSRNRYWNRRIRKQMYFLRSLCLFVVVGMTLVFIVTALATVVQSEMNISSVPLNKWTSPISKGTWLSTLSMEIPQLREFNQQKRIQSPSPSAVLMEMVTSFNPNDPRSLIRRELPNFAYFDGQIAVAGQGVNYTDFPMESHISIEEIMKDRQAIVPEEPKKEEDQQKDMENPPSLTTNGRKVVMIYHTHNTESWLPYLPEVKDPDYAYHQKVNITLLGKRLGEELEKRGIGTIVNTDNIAQRLINEGLDYSDSYTLSKQL